MFEFKIDRAHAGPSWRTVLTRVMFDHDLGIRGIRVFRVSENIVFVVNIFLRVFPEFVAGFGFQILLKLNLLLFPDSVAEP